eukprot:s3094_g11.t1
MPPVCLERARKLYVILSSVLKGRPLAILRGVEDRNGFECWRQLTCQFSPRTRSRSLAMLSAIMAREQLMSFERLISEYEKASGNPLPGDVKLSVVLKAIPKALQSHVHLRMDASTTYEDVKNLVLSYEVDQEGSVSQIKGQDIKLVLEDFTLYHFRGSCEKQNWKVTLLTFDVSFPAAPSVRSVLAW